MDGGVVAIGLSGPGVLVTPHSQISIEEVSPSNGESAACLKGQMAQAITHLQIARLRPVDAGRLRPHASRIPPTTTSTP
jgi:hypothetical protein